MWRWLLVTALILSFCTGFNFLTLPFAVSQSGFWPGIVAAVIIWFFLLVTGLLYLEATLAAPIGANVFSISAKFTGSFGKWLASILVAILNYAYLIVYLFIVSPIICAVFDHLGFHIPTIGCTLVFGAILFISAFLGVGFTLILNFILTVLLISFSYLIFSSHFTLTMENLDTGNWDFVLLALPTVFNALFYQTIIPTASAFLKKKRKHLVSAISVGISLASLFFIAWFWLVVSHTERSQEQVLAKLDPEYLNFAHLRAFHHFGKWVPYLLCIGATSALLSIGLLLVDFLFDAAGTELSRRKGWKRLCVTVLIFVPTVSLSLLAHDSLLYLLLIIGEIGTLFLGAILPIWWVWALRYHEKIEIKPIVPGGKPFLFILTVLSLFLFYLVGLEFVYQTF